jgi:hypothetical protein
LTPRTDVPNDLPTLPLLALPWKADAEEDEPRRWIGKGMLGMGTMGAWVGVPVPDLDSPSFGVMEEFADSLGMVGT